MTTNAPPRSQVDPGDSPSGRFLRFCINGVFATLVHFAVLWVFVNLLQFGSVGVSNGLAACVGIAFSYTGNRLYVFRSAAPVIATGLRFIAIYVIIALFHFAFLAVWSDIFGLDYRIGFLVATTCAVLGTYLANLNVVFRGSA